MSDDLAVELADAASDALIGEIRQQIDELLAWKSAVPLDALWRCHFGNWNYPGWDIDQDEAVRWLRSTHKAPEGWKP